MKNGNELVLQSRDRLIFSHLGLLRLLDRDQLRCLAKFGSVSRINVRLAKLRSAGYIVRYYTASSTGSKRAVYALSKTGAAEVNQPFVPPQWKPDSILLGNSFAAHQLALGDIYIAARGNGPIQWRTFSLPPAASVPVIPDAAIGTDSTTFFIEMDMGTEALPIWTRKVGLYMKLALSGAYREVTPHAQFCVLVVTLSEQRLYQLRRHVSKQTQKLFWFQTLSTIQQQGFWSAVWLRPIGDTLSPPGA